MDDVKLDLRNMGVKRWRTRALDGTEWASVIWEAKAKLGVFWSAKEERLHEIFVAVSFGFLCYSTV